MSSLVINIILDKHFNKVVPKPVNNRPGYDIRYVSAYMRNYRYDTDLEKNNQNRKTMIIYPLLDRVKLHSNGLFE